MIGKYKIIILVCFIYKPLKLYNVYSFNTLLQWKVLYVKENFTIILLSLCTSQRSSLMGMTLFFIIWHMAISCITFSRFQFNNLIYQVVSYVGNFFSSQLQITIILYLFYVYWYYLTIAQVNIIHLMNYNTLINNDYTCMLSQKCS